MLAMKKSAKLISWRSNRRTSPDLEQHVLNAQKKNCRSLRNSWSSANLNKPETNWCHAKRLKYIQGENVNIVIKIFSDKFSPIK